MPETPLDLPRHWVEFQDPANPQQWFRCDLTWLTSSWTCIYGSGCKGIYGAGETPWVGCCALGAHFCEQDDLDKVTEVAEQLTEVDWQHHPGPHGSRLHLDHWTEVEDGDRKTRVVDGACIFQNQPDFPGGGGCALHHFAVRTGKAPHTVKPDVCWQLPIRRTYREVTRQDDTTYLEVTITEYDRRGWGPGGHDLDWYCSGNPEAHVAREPVYRNSQAELVELMGQRAYDVLVVHCESHLASVRRARAAGARNLLPLLVHPATLEAHAVGGLKRRVPRVPAPAPAKTTKAVKSATRGTTKASGKGTPKKS